MIVLIAESKTMERVEREISPEIYSSNIPVGEEDAAEIMDGIRRMDLSDISLAVKISERMAADLKKMAYEFPNKSTGYRAIEAYNGVVFKNLDYNSLSMEERCRVDENVRIISSLYGWLLPGDIIKPYRLDYSSVVSPDDTSLFTFWRGKVTVQLVKALQASGETAIIDLLPADAAKCIDWKLVKRFAKVWKVDFLQQSGETVRSPHAGKLKALRGELLRNIIRENIQTPKDLTGFLNEKFLPIPDYKYSDRIAFYVN